ncbi:MAG: peptidylprolyl isomerase [Clostridium butyricum]|nr:peptidylprolyl isomerase [Clostridium butyricum]
MKRKKHILLICFMLIIGMFNLVGCGSDNTNKDKKDATEKIQEETSKEIVESNEKLPIVTMKIKDYGTVKLELYPEVAPNTVNNFISLSNSGFYDGLKFHRVIKGFMIQGGDPDGVGTGGPGYSIVGEFTSNGFANSLKHTKGVISMARSNNPDSAGSQFFIMSEDAPHLDGEYAAFGKVISGIEVVENIEKVDTDSNDAPKEDVVIESITVDTKGLEYKDPEKIE